MSIDHRAGTLCTEIGLLIGHSGSLAAQETRRNYILLRKRGIEHNAARECAIDMAAETLESHARVYGIAPSAATEYRRSAELLRSAIAQEVAA